MENKNHNKLNTPLAILIGSVIIGVSVVLGLTLSGGHGNTMIDPDKVFQGRAFASNEMLIGKTSDDVIFLEYSDTECPFCKMFNNDVTLKIKENYKGKIGFAYRKYPLPMHPQATTESLAALCAREQGGVELYERYNQETFARTKSNNGMADGETVRIATDLKMDMNKFNACVTASSTKEMLRADIADGAAAGVEGTPYSMILIRRGDQYQILARINGARDYAYVSRAIDQAIKYK